MPAPESKNQNASTADNSASTPTILGSKKSAGSTVFVVKHDVLGTHPRSGFESLKPKLKGETVTREELGEACDIDRLISLGAIEPLIAAA